MKLFSRRSKKAVNSSQIKISRQITTETLEIAEYLNLHFSTIGERLASEISASDIEPEIYRTPTETSFSLKAPSLDVVDKLPGGGGGGGVLDISLGGEVRRGPSYPDPV